MDTLRHLARHRFLFALTSFALTAAALAPRAALAQYAATVLADKPVAYYRFDEAAGATFALNSAPTGAIDDGIIHAANGQSLAFRKPGALPVADPASVAFGFSNAFVTIPRLVQDDFTIEFFFRTTAPGPGNGLGQFYTGTGLINGDVPDARDDFGLSFSAGHVLFGVGNASGHDLTIRTPGGLNDGKWHLVDAVRTRATGSIELFIDGQSVAAATGGTQSLNAAADLQIGKIASDFGPTPSASNPFSGDLDEIALYPTALTAERIAKHYAAATTPAPPGTTTNVGSPSVYNGEPGGLRVILAHKLVGHSDYVNSVAFSPDSHTVVSGARDKTIRLWDVPTGMQKSILGKHDNFVSSVAFSPDGRSVASGGWDNKIKEFDVASGQEVSEGKYDKHQSYVLSLVYGPRGRRIASGSNDRTARTFSRATGVSSVTTILPDAVASVAFSPNSERLAGACLDGTVYVWEAATLKLLHHLVPAAPPATPQFAVVFLDDDTLAAGGKDGIIHVWTIHDESPLANLTTGGHEVYGLAYDAIHRVLAGGGTDRIVRFWAAHNIKLAKGGNVAPATTAAGHRNTVRALAFSPDGTLLASGSWDFDIDLWHLSTRDARDRVIVDPLDDLGRTFRHTDGWSIDAANPADFGNDASRLHRTGDKPENIIYHSTDLKSFSARVYFQAGAAGNATPGVTPPPDAPAPFDVAGRVTVYASPDNVTYKPVPFTHDALVPNDVTSGWLRTTLQSALPIGTNYLKIEFASDPAPGSLELSEVRLVGAGS